MKKIIGIVLFILLSFTSFGQNFDVFTLNDQGLCVITKTISTNNSMEKNQMLAKSYLKTVEADVNIKDNIGDDVVATVKFNTKVSYNPFAGTFTEWLSFDIKFTFSGSKVTYTVYDIVVTNMYSGSGRTTENRATMEEKIMQYNHAKEKLKENLSGKEKREYKDIVEDWEDSLENHEEEFTKRVTNAIDRKFN